MRLPPPPSRGPLVCGRVAAELVGSTVRSVEAWLVDGLVYSERVGNNVFVDLNDVERVANQDRGRGSE
jgi:hypothetical protein